MYLLCLNVSSGSGVVIAHYIYVQTYEYFIVDVYRLECFVFDSFEGSFPLALGNCFIHWSRSCHVLRDSSSWPLLIGSGVSTELKLGQSESSPDFFWFGTEKRGPVLSSHRHCDGLCMAQALSALFLQSRSGPIRTRKGTMKYSRW